MNADTKNTIISNVVIQGVEGLVNSEIALFVLAKSKDGISIICGDATLNTKIAGKCLGITVLVS